MIAALKGQNKVPTSGRGWQERESGRREGERRGAGGRMARGRQNVGVSGAGSSSTVRKGERSTEANHAVPQRRSVFVFILETTEAAREKGRWQGLTRVYLCFVLAAPRSRFQVEMGAIRWPQPLSRRDDSSWWKRVVALEKGNMQVFQRDFGGRLSKPRELVGSQ